MFEYENDSTTRNDFYVALINFCDNLVTEVATPILKRADELYDNTAIRWLVMRYDKLDERYNRQRKNYMEDIIEGAANPIEPAEYLKEERHELQTLLWEMLRVSE